MTDEERKSIYRATAQTKLANDDLEFDDNATVSLSDGGAWVQAWVWVYDDVAGLDDRTRDHGDYDKGGR
jgi:hypothetical protein